MKTTEERFKNMHLLSRQERRSLADELQRTRPDFLKQFAPPWWWWQPCKVKVLIVTDGGLNYGTTGFGLSEFLTAFNELESQSSINYEVTLAHRGTIINSPNPVVVNHISNFNFNTSVNLPDFDQLWIFGIDSGASISSAERNAIEAFMDGGGGVFATGDHGTLGGAIGRDVARIKDMRYWDNFPNSVDSEVGMGNRRRNDTNQPEAGSAISNFFDNQSDDVPQTIAVRTFGAGMPHPLLSISASLRPSRIIDVMPDHPHEGECKPETSFTVNGTTVPTQIIATSFVRGGSTTYGGAGKDATEPHCFPSIAVWDGWQANVGRIVIDSTWHHFVNINLNGVGSGPFGDIPGQEPGLTATDWVAVRQYFMNIATWMSRRKYWWCWRRRILFELLNDSQLIEASLDNPLEERSKVSLADINSIGALAEEILASKFNPVFARTFLLEILEEVNPNLATQLDVWSPIKSKKAKSYYQEWINYDLLLYTAIGSGFLSLKNNKAFLTDKKISEKSLTKIDGLFSEGMEYGFAIALKDLESKMRSSIKSIKAVGKIDKQIKKKK